MILGDLGPATFLARIIGMTLVRRGFYIFFLSCSTKIRKEIQYANTYSDEDGKITDQ